MFALLNMFKFLAVYVLFIRKYNQPLPFKNAFYK